MKCSFRSYPLNLKSKEVSSILEHGTVVLKQGTVCIGNFDGIHLGHKELIKSAHRESLKLGISNKEISLLSFYPHPRNIIFPNEKKINLITPLRARINLLEKAPENIAIDNLLVLRFSKALSQFSADDFIKEVVIKYFNPKLVVVGFDWHFGKGREGNPELLKKLGEQYGFQVFIMPEFLLDGKKVGARDIRTKLLDGDMEGASRLLGNNFTLTGLVVKGDGRGRQLGFPTANMRLFRQLYPKKGVYYSKVVIGTDTYSSITNIGSRPTFTTSEVCKVETHILDFNKDIYGKEISVELIDFLRPEKKFNSVTELLEQIALDVQSRKDYADHSR